jgi:hypothetical protein
VSRVGSAGATGGAAEWRVALAATVK